MTTIDNVPYHTYIHSLVEQILHINLSFIPYSIFNGIRCIYFTSVACYERKCKWRDSHISTTTTLQSRPDAEPTQTSSYADFNPLVIFLNLTCSTAPENVIREPLEFYFSLGMNDQKIAEHCVEHYDTEHYGLRYYIPLNH
jgi:hypothetical protein